MRTLQTLRQWASTNGERLSGLALGFMAFTALIYWGDKYEKYLKQRGDKVYFIECSGKTAEWGRDAECSNGTCRWKTITGAAVQSNQACKVQEMGYEGDYRDGANPKQAVTR